MLCDICFSFEEGTGTIVSFKEMKSIVRNGFGPRKAGINMPMDTVMKAFGSRIPGMPVEMPEEMDENWRQLVLASSKPWELCTDCYAKTRPYISLSQAKKWWEFWK